MSEPNETVPTEALTERLTEPRTVAELATSLPDHPRDAIEQAVTLLSDAGVLARTLGEDGETRYSLGDVSRYRLVNADVVRRPDANTGRGPR